MKQSIIVTDFTKKIGEKTVLDHISMEIEAGSSIWIKGINGCGKTMLLRALSGLILPDSGSVSVFGTTLSPKKRFPDDTGIIIENTRFWGNLTGFQTLKVLAGMKDIVGDAELADSLKRVGLDPADKRSVRKYSLGMKQRLAIAQAIMEHPKLLLLDEPLNALDESGCEMVRSIIREEQERGTTIVIASHISEHLEGLFDREIFMKEGRVVSA